MKLIVGLGNPEKSYQNTRHNLGQKIVKEFVETFCKTSLRLKKNFAAELIEFNSRDAIHGVSTKSDKIIFAISTNYMNNSGVTIQKIANFYKINPSDIYIIHDDLDLEVGDYKIQFDRGSAGHNGIKSIIENLGTQQFNRIRIGIGKPINSIPVEDYVLKPFSKSELDIIDSIIPKIFEEIKKITGC
jgi:PTH1 family peptidyl-tRNA hydrolase